MASHLVQATSDNHVGHFFMNYMKTNPDELCQIDAATGEQESRRSVVSRATRLAQCLRRLGLAPGDVLVLGGRNHLHVHIPFYAALLNGLPMAGVDPLFQYSEIKLLFSIVSPKVAFCETEMYEVYCRAARDLGLATRVFTFDGEHGMAQLMDSYTDLEPEDQFEIAKFDVSCVPCWLVSTSGSTGFPKVAALSHSNVLQNTGFFSYDAPNNAGERRAALNLSSTQWISACYNVLCMPVHHVRLQTSAPPTTDHVIDVINQYRPAAIMTTATLLAPLLGAARHCDLTCFDVIKVAGSKVHAEFLHALRARVREDTLVLQGYGLTECGGTVFDSDPAAPLGSLGRLRPEFTAKLVNPETGKIISEPNVPGELLARGPRMEGYYNDPQATADAFTEDGFVKTGDLMYRDDGDYYFFVDRLKMLLKYKNYQVVPPEVEEVVLRHAGVRAACVVGVPHARDGERVAAAVVRRDGSRVSAQDIKDLVAKELSVHKQLHGGVVFLPELPLTSNGKVQRLRVRELVVAALRDQRDQRDQPGI